MKDMRKMKVDVPCGFLEKIGFNILCPAVDIVAENRITRTSHEVIASHVNTVCQRLEDHLREHRLRVIINRPRPECVTGVFEHVTFHP